MLIRAMLLVAFLAALGETIAFAAAGLARMSFHAKEAAAVRAAFAGAILQAQEAAISGTLPTPATTCVLAGEQGCSIRIQTVIAVATPVPGTAPSACPSTQCVVFEQNNSHVGESRANYSIAQYVLASNGDVMIHRAATVTFRTFAAPPYASLAGSIDETLDAVSARGTGDDAGNADGSSSTLIHVEYRAAGTGARQSGDVWRGQSEHPATASAAWDN
ncbi:MAG TPA: hypothetical protein VFN49_06095 [Candidatus Aquilonibacter sp.]|nr:hypothetical protein [Candidatus Aquilonibacter sp.]